MDGFDENLKLVAYEGGQHIKQLANRVNFHPNMYDLYIKYLEALDDYLSVFAHYVNAGQCSDDNCWGAKEFTGQSMDDAPKYRALYDYDRNTTTSAAEIRIIPGKVEVFPIPFDDQVTVRLENAFFRSAVLFSPHGQVLRQVEAATTDDLIRLNTSGLAPGMYYLMVSTSEGDLLSSVILKTN